MGDARDQKATGQTCPSCGGPEAGARQELARLRESGKVSMLKALDFVLRHHPELEPARQAELALDLARPGRRDERRS